jgi:uncharacterized SAM-binding protein YcdF (DUF218 family)
MRGGIIFKLIFLLFLAAILFALYLVRDPLLGMAGGFWIVQDPLAPADAIIVLSDDNVAGDRANRAAELYKARWAPLVVASGRMLRSYASVSELMDHDLIQHGVPASAIVIFHHSAQNTLEEAKALRGLVGQNRWRRVIIVTSSFHTRRARYIFRRVLPPDVEIEMAPASDSDYDPNSWWQHRESVKLFFHELGGMFVSMWELRRTAGPSGVILELAAWRLLSNGTG